MSMTLFHLLLTYQYWIIIPLAFIEGPALSIFLGFMLSLGYLQWLHVYLTLVLGDLLPDILYYFIGRWSKQRAFFQRHAHKVGLSQSRIKLFEWLWQTHTIKSMLLAKWALGLSNVLLMTAGFAHLSFLRFLLHALFVTLLQYAILLIFGYYYGASYLLMKHYFYNAEIFIVGTAFFMIIAYIFLTSYVRRAVYSTSHS